MRYAKDEEREPLCGTVGDNPPIQRAAGGCKAVWNCFPKFDPGVSCEKQDVLAALRQNEWRRQPQFEWYRGPFPSHV